MSKIAKDPNSLQAAVERLLILGYAFNNDGELRQIDLSTKGVSNKGYVFELTDDHNSNQKHYEKLAECIPSYVYALLEQIGLTRVPIPFENKVDERTFYFSKPADLKHSRKLLVLIHGSGFVRAGQWARSLIINQSLNHGTQIPYIKQAEILGYNVLLMNTNDNYYGVNGKMKQIPHAGSPNEHANYIMEHVIIPAQPRSVAIVAHSYGGTVVFNMVSDFFKFFQNTVYAIALTDAVVPRLSETVEHYAQKVACNWLASMKPLNTSLIPQDNLVCVSAGHTKHEYTTHAAKSAVFAFLERKYDIFKDIQAARERLGTS